MIPITLTPSECLMGAQVGINRHVAAIKNNRPDRHGHDGAGWNLHIEGACGELAFCKAVGLFWSGSVNTFKSEADAGQLIEVRTRSKHDYDLIIRPDDDGNRFFVLVTGLAPNYQVHGYILAAHARKPEWLQDYGNRPQAWFVPKAALSDVAIFKQKVAA